VYPNRQQQSANVESINQDTHQHLSGTISTLNFLQTERLDITTQVQQLTSDNQDNDISLDVTLETQSNDDIVPHISTLLIPQVVEPSTISLPIQLAIRATVSNN
jgi:hypothetical protein